MSLLASQRAFCAYLVDDPCDIMERVGGDAGPGLAVYHHAYRAQLVSCLRDSYEGTWAWLGDEAFEVSARAYVSSSFPTSWTLGDYGGGFPETLRRLYPEDPEVGDLAALDWALRRAFDGEDAQALEPGDVSDVDWDRAILRLVPTLRLISITTNAVAIWNAIASDQQPPAAEELMHPATVRIWRQHLSPRFRSIDPAEVSAIDAARGGTTFASLCDRLAQDMGVERATEHAGALLGTWLGDGVISGIEM